MGALVGAPLTRNTNKNNNKQRISHGYDSESGTTYLENPAYGWVFAFLHPDSPSNCVRLFAAQRLTPSGPARQARCSTPAALVRVRAPLFKEPAQKAVFCFSTSGLFIELSSIIRRTAAHPFGASATRALFNACGVSPSLGTTYSENPAYGWVFAFLRPISVGFYHAVSSVPLRPIPHRIFSQIHFQIAHNTLIQIAILSPKAAKSPFSGNRSAQVAALLSFQMAK
ncbi:Uncharacterised protein [Klebsiella quasivariicola]|uniref:Uncharacterized protein n=2 Tax=Klebsiella quasivariicola TaxID=2026240 RepID=A0A8B4TVS5_9ENTR|nr:Uncharacterised protein [Klebsiella quasivariicola]